MESPACLGRDRGIECGVKMPVQQCQEDGKPGFKWGEQGKCYTYNPTSARSKAMARLKAEAQGRAVKARQKNGG